MSIIQCFLCDTEREGQAQRRYEEELRKRQQLSPAVGSTSSRQITNTSDDQGDYSEIIEEKGLPLNI